MTSSNGALPKHTTAPLAPPAMRDVSATSEVRFLFRTPRWRSSHGFLPGGAGVSDVELRMRLVDV